MMDKIAFSLSFLRNPATSVSRIGSTGSKPVVNADTVLKLSNFWEIEGKSTPAKKVLILLEFHYNLSLKWKMLLASLKIILTKRWRQRMIIQNEQKRTILITNL